DGDARTSRWRIARPPASILRMRVRLVSPFVALPFVALLASLAQAQQLPAHVPPPDAWERRAPEQVGMDPSKLAAAVAFAQAHPTDWPRDFSTQERQFGRLLGPIPKTRADTNGVIVRRGYLVAEFGDTAAVDPTYSVAKSMLSSAAAIAVRDRKVPDLDEPVGARVHDGGYDG